MRLITRRAIYRAFPELDRFDDERCDRFVRAAGRGFWKKVRAFTLMVSAGALILALVYLLEVGLTVLLTKAGLDAWPGWMIVVLGVTPVVAGVFGGAWTRDLHLRRRIRRVLRTRGVCTGCRYSLVGLMVGEDHRVVCPECGADTLVDPSLGELAMGEDGRARFRPGDDPLGLGPRFWTPARVQRLKRIAKWTAIGVPSLLLLIGASYEGFLRWQASVARRERPTNEQIRAFMEGPSAAAAGDGEDAWEVFFRLEDERAAIAAATELPDDGAGIGMREVPDYDGLDLVEPPSYAREDPQALARFERQRETAARLMDAYEKARWFERLGELKAARVKGRWPAPIGPGPALDSAVWRELDVARQWARILRARMSESRRNGDVERYIEDLKTNFAMVKLIGATPTTGTRTTARMLDANALRSVRQIVMDGPDQAWLVPLENALSEREPGPGFEEALRGDELLVLEAAAWMFEEPSRARGGRFSSTARQLTGQVQIDAALGTYAGTKTEIRRLFDEFSQAAGLPKLERDRLWPTLPGLVVISRYGPWLGHDIIRERLWRLDESSLRVMITLEWYRRFKGRYPEKLEQMGVTFVMPMDPWSGEPIRYVRLGPGEDPQGRGYLLYSVGPDGVDDGGKKAWSPFSSGLANDQPGADFILNDRNRW